MKPMLLIVMAILASSTAFAQRKVEGRVLDAQSQEPIPFASIGFEGSFVGTAANEEGYFELTVPGSMLSKTLWVQHLSYQAQQLDFQSLDGPALVSLQPEVTTLQAVVVTPYSPIEMLQKAYEHVPDNYPMDEHGYEGYYMVQLMEDGKYLDYSEAVVRMHQPDVADRWAQAPTVEEIAAARRKRQLPEMPNQKPSDIYIVEARRSKDVVDLDMWSRQMEKEREKQRRKAEKEGEEIYQPDQGLGVNVGGPHALMEETIYNSFDLLKEALKNPKLSDYTFWFDGQASYFGRQMTVIAFDVDEDSNKPGMRGRLLIDPETFAVASVEFFLSENGRDRIVPRAVKTLLWTLGIRFEIREVQYTMNYTLQNGRWYLGNAQLAMGAHVWDKNKFHKNEDSYFQLRHSLIITDLYPKWIGPIYKDLPVLDAAKSLSAQVGEENELFWENYTVTIPGNFLR